MSQEIPPLCRGVKVYFVTGPGRHVVEGTVVKTTGLGYSIVTDTGSRKILQPSDLISGQRF